MKNVVKTPIGQIEVTERHRTYKGVVFKQGDKLDYYNVINKSESCGCTQVVTYTKFYEVKGGLIPVNKAKIL